MSATPGDMFLGNDDNVILYKLDGFILNDMDSRESSTAKSQLNDLVNSKKF